MNEGRISRVVNKCINALNKEDKITEEEVVVVIAQLLIKTGKALYDPEDKIQEMNWMDLNKEYYTNKESSIGLGLLLNGGQMMGAVNQNKLKGMEKKNDRISASIKSTQKDSRVAVSTNETKRSRRGRKKDH